MIRKLLAAAVAFGFGYSAWTQTYAHKLLGTHGYVHGIGINDAGDYWFTAQEDPDYTSTSALSSLYINGSNYSANVLGSSWHQVWRPAVLNNGTVLWTVNIGTPGSHWTQKNHLFVNGSDYSGSMYGDEYNCGSYAFNQSGQVAMAISEAPGQYYPYDVWMGDRNVSQEVLGPNRGASEPTFMAADGTLFWSGTNETTGPYAALFRDTVNFTTALLGTGGHDGPYAFSGAPSGAFAWSGAGPNTGTKRHVFSGTNDLSYQVFHDLTHRADLSAVNNAGQVAWWGGHPGAHDSDFYRDTENMSSFLGPTRSIGQFGLLDDLGNVYWYGSSVGVQGPADIYVNRSNFTTPILGDGHREFQLWSVSPNGHLLWSGSSSVTGNQERLFVDHFDVSGDALGPNATYLLWDQRMNSAGAVIWDVLRPSGLHEVWLSTPVPEPQAAGTLITALGGLLLGSRMRNGRRRGITLSRPRDQL